MWLPLAQVVNIVPWNITSLNDILKTHDHYILKILEIEIGDGPEPELDKKLSVGGGWVHVDYSISSGPIWVLILRFETWDWDFMRERLEIDLDKDQELDISPLPCPISLIGLISSITRRRLCFKTSICQNHLWNIKFYNDPKR